MSEPLDLLRDAATRARNSDLEGVWYAADDHVLGRAVPDYDRALIAAASPENVLALVAEVERLHTNNAELAALTQPILDRTEGHIGTHSSRCFEYHVACLAHLVRERLTEIGDPSSLNSQEEA